MRRDFSACIMWCTRFFKNCKKKIGQQFIENLIFLKKKTLYTNFYLHCKEISILWSSCKYLWSICKNPSGSQDSRLRAFVWCNSKLSVLSVYWGKDDFRDPNGWINGSILQYTFFLKPSAYKDLLFGQAYSFPNLVFQTFHDLVHFNLIN